MERKRKDAGRGGAWGGREAQEAGDVCTRTADSLGSTAETTTAS